MATRYQRANSPGCHPDYQPSLLLVADDTIPNDGIYFGASVGSLFLALLPACGKLAQLL